MFYWDRQDDTTFKSWLLWLDTTQVNWVALKRALIKNGSRDIKFTKCPEKERVHSKRRWRECSKSPGVAQVKWLRRNLFLVKVSSICGLSPRRSGHQCPFSRFSKGGMRYFSRLTLKSGGASNVKYLPQVGTNRQWNEPGEITPSQGRCHWEKNGLVTVFFPARENRKGLAFLPHFKGVDAFRKRVTSESSLSS